MKETAIKEKRQRRRRMADLTSEVAALDTMTVSELARRFEELYGWTTASRNKDYLRKRLTWRLQELAQGGLSDSAKASIETLANAALPRWRAFRNGEATLHEKPANDTSVPPVGTVLKREYGGVVHEAIVLPDGFEYQGRCYPNLSRIAREITGTKWNGNLFWRVKRRTSKGKEKRK